MDIKPIRTEDDYREALDEIDRLIDSHPGTLEHDRLGVLSILVEAYETDHYPIPLPDPQAALEFHRERLGSMATGEQIKDFLDRGWPDELIIMEDGKIEPYNEDGEFALDLQREYDLSQFGDLFWDWSGDDYMSFEDAYHLFAMGRTVTAIIPEEIYETVTDMIVRSGGSVIERSDHGGDR